MQNRNTHIYSDHATWNSLCHHVQSSRTFQMDNSQNPLSYHDAYWVAKIKPEGAPAKITVINDMHLDTSYK